MKRVCILVLCCILTLGIVPIAAETTGFAEDYESYEEGVKPTYGPSGWSGDNAQAFAKAEVVSLEGNKVLKLHSTGDGVVRAIDMLVYRNLELSAGVDQVFQTRLMTEDANGYKTIMLRGATADEKYEILRLDTGDQLYICGEPMGEYKKGEWMDVKIWFRTNSLKGDVYLNGNLVAIADLSGISLLNPTTSLRMNIMGSNDMGAVTTLYIDNTAMGMSETDFTQTQTSTEENPGQTPESEEGMPADETGLILCQDSPNAMHDKVVEQMGETTAIRPQVVDSVTYLPLRYVSESLGGSLEWNGQTSSTVVNINGQVLEFTSDSRQTIKNGEPVNMNAPVRTIADSMYIPIEAMETLFEMGVTQTEFGGISVHKKDQTVSEAQVDSMLPQMLYARPTKETILEKFNSFAPAHPRIIINGDRLEEIRKAIAEDQTVKEWYIGVKRIADNALNTPVYQYELRDGQRLLMTANDMTTVIIHCAFVYLIEGDETYAQRAWQELEAGAAFPDWHPMHFLDTAEMTMNSAIGYDWLYDYLSDQQKEVIRQAIIEKGLKAGMEAYEGTAQLDGSVGAYHNRIGWTQDSSNWSFVCNGGMIAGALAIMGDTKDEICPDIVSRALRSIEYPLKAFAPDGAWVEGVGYWDYATRFFIYTLSSMKNTLGTDFNYLYSPGATSTAYFPLYNIGPVGTFNYGDAGQGVLNSPSFFWYADVLDDPGLAQVRLNMMEEYHLPSEIKDILYYRPTEESQKSELANDRFMRGIETATFRSGWGSTQATFIGIHGGSNQASHGDLDVATFVFDALGERWAVDLGTENYNLPGYWGWPDRANYYRKRAEGHNTLVINPGSGMDQTADGHGVLLDYRTGTYGGYATYDFSSAYRDSGASVKRAVGLYDNRSKGFIHDEISSQEPMDVYWFMQTPAQITVAPDGKSATLKIGEKSLLMKLMSSDPDAKITYGDAVPLPSSPKGEGQTPNTGISRIAIQSKGVRQLNMQVLLIPYGEGEEPEEIMPGFTSLDQLSSLDLEKQTKTVIEEILIDGQPMTEFSPMVTGYQMNRTYDQPETAQIEVKTPYEAQVEMEGDEVTITVSDPSGALRPTVYRIFMRRLLPTGDLETANTIPVQAVTTSEDIEPQNPGPSAADGDLSTKWASLEKQWICFDLGTESAHWRRGRILGKRRRADQLLYH